MHHELWHITGEYFLLHCKLAQRQKALWEVFSSSRCNGKRLTLFGKDRLKAIDNQMIANCPNCRIVLGDPEREKPG